VQGARVSVAVVGSRTEADLIVGLLGSEGVAAVVSSDDAGGQEPQLQLHGVHVVVASSDAASARRILADAVADAVADRRGDDD
jgi:Putative prokaryotic signal transducing protein